MKLSSLNDAFRPSEGLPRQTLGAFLRWCLSGAWPALSWAAFISAAAGVMEVISAFLLGRVIDSALSSTPATVFADNWPLFLGFTLKLGFSMTPSISAISR